jgi:hypothetical protein
MMRDGKSWMAVTSTAMTEWGTDLGSEQMRSATCWVL